MNNDKILNVLSMPNLANCNRVTRNAESQNLSSCRDYYKIVLQ
jgi:hypothetical protein